MTKELLFSVTADDLEWSITKGSGKGGQKRNKTSSAVHVKHVESGALGYSETSRSQFENKTLAFKRMVDTPKFQAWLKMESLKRLGVMKRIEEEVERAMIPRNLKVEGIVDGRWTEVERCDA